MRGWIRIGTSCGAVFLTSALLPCSADAQALGLFTQSGDVGTPSTIGPGSAKYDAASKSYFVTGGGENMWAAADHFHYLWKKVSGDVLLEASVEFTDSRPAGTPPAGHRKACLVIRQALDSNAVYADAARHGDGLTSLQWRDTAAGRRTRCSRPLSVPPAFASRSAATTYRCRSPVRESHCGQREGAAKLELTGEFYVGLGVTVPRHRTARDRQVLRRHAGNAVANWSDDHAREHARDHQSEIEGSARGVRRDAAATDRSAELVPRCHQHAVFQQRRQAVQDSGGPARRAAQPEPAGRAGACRSRHADTDQQRPRRHRRRQVLGDQRSITDGQRTAIRR